MTKAELEAKVKLLEASLGSITTGHTISNCHINVDADEGVVAVAEAVTAGMNALTAAHQRNITGMRITTEAVEFGDD